ncbi:MAG: MBL fold metallo-hydrolase [Crocinitomicaceae bacterium]
MIGKVRILGSGTSQGIPMIACDCDVCQSTDPRDRRLRSSILLELNGLNYCIDAGPDFRYQLLREKVKHLEGILFTHEHKDHVAGLDDVRAFNYFSQKPMNIYCSKNVETALHREFHYVFNEKNYPGIPKINLIPIDKNPFNLDGIEVIPIEVMHYKLPVLGFRIGSFAYITDAKTVAEEEKNKLKNVDILIINALHKFPHISHFNLEEALAFIDEIKPKKAYLTHISHLLGKHEEILKELPKHVSLLYDGLSFEFSY